jgi:LysM repeat protein
LKIKFIVKKTFTGLVLISWFFSSLACSQGYLGARELTATAQVNQPARAVIVPTQTPAPLKPTATFADIPTVPVPVLETETPVPQPTDTVATLVPTSQVTQTSLPGHIPTASASITLPPPSANNPNEKPPILYYAQSGDTLSAVAVRFGVKTEQILSPQTIPAQTLITPGQVLVIPDVLENIGPNEAIFPDSEIVYSPSAVDFNIHAFVGKTNGYLSTYKEYLSTGWNSGADVIQRVATENSVNPRLLLALIEHQSHWVYGNPTNLAETDYPLGHVDVLYKGLFKQLNWAVQQLAVGYYGWRAGLVTELDFPQKEQMRLAPGLNAGTTATQLLFSKLYDRHRWNTELYGEGSVLETYKKMFDNPWIRAQTVEPLYPTTLTQPEIQLPFEAGRVWSYTGGPHSAWGPDGALAAIDFAPSSYASGCVESTEWVVSATSGLVVRSENGAVIVDLDGDGHEQTGWVIMYMHIATKGRVPVGTLLDINDKIGHPSCEGGRATGTHTHVARKYNGEWILADGPVPFVLSGWQVHAGKMPYLGTLTKDNKTVEANIYGSFETHISRQVAP